jgi:hypothetical protein
VFAGALRADDGGVIEIGTKTLATTARAAIVGVVFGIGLDAATLLMATAGPTGDTWSFRGNGALVVPIGFGAAVLAGGWMGLFLYARGARAWAPVAASITAAAAVPSLLSIAVLVVFGSAAQEISDLMVVPTVAWPVLSLTSGAVADLQPAPTRRLPHVSAYLAVLVFSIALGAGFFGAEAALTL